MSFLKFVNSMTYPPHQSHRILDSSNFLPKLLFRLLFLITCLLIVLLFYCTLNYFAVNKLKKLK